MRTQPEEDCTEIRKKYWRAVVKSIAACFLLVPYLLFYLIIEELYSSEMSVDFQRTATALHCRKIVFFLKTYY